MSTTAAVCGGRHSNGPAERVVHWKAHVSKKAAKRYKRRREAAGAAADLARKQQEARLVATLGHDAVHPRTVPAPTPAELAAASAANRAIIESMVAGDPTPLSTVAALRAVDADALVAGLAAGAIPGTRSNHTYAIRVLGAQGRFDDAVAHFHAMAARGIEPSGHTYTALLSACAQQRNVPAAFRVFEAARAAAAARIVAFLPPPQRAALLLPPPASSGALPLPPVVAATMTAVTTTTEAPATATSTTTAVAVAVDAVRSGPAGSVAGKYLTTPFTPLPVTVATMLHEGAASGAAPVAVTAAALQVQPAYSAHAPTEVAYGALMQACVRGLDLPAAFDALAMAAADGVRLSTVHFTTLMSGCVQAGEYERAWAVFHHMRQHHAEPDAVTFSVLMAACAKTDQVERALGLLTEMKQMRMAPTAVTYNTLIHAAGRSMRRHAAAHDLLAEMRAAGHTPDMYSYNAVLLACSHTGDVARARRYLWEAARDGLVPDLTTYNTLLAVYARALRRGPPPEPTAEARALAAADGRELLALEEPGTADALDAATARVRRRAVGDYARLVTGDVDTLVENLLADYYADDKAPAPTPEDAAADRAEGGDDVSGALPPLATFKQDLDDAEYREARDYLTAAGVRTADADLVAEFEADNERYPALAGDEVAVRARVDALADANWRSQVADTAVTLLHNEELVAARSAALAARVADLEASLAAAEAEEGGSAGVLGGLTTTGAAGGTSLQEGTTLQRMELAALRRLVSGKLLFDEFMTPGGDGAAAVTGGGSGAPAADSLVTRLPTPLADGRLSFKAFMRQVEADVDTELFGAAGARRMPSLLEGSDGELGGQKVSDLLDVRNIPVPPTSDSDGEHDPIALHDHLAGVVGARVAAALEREYGDPVAMAAAAERQLDEFSGGEISDAAEALAERERAPVAVAPSAAAHSGVGGASSAEAAPLAAAGTAAPATTRASRATRATRATRAGRTATTVPGISASPAVAAAATLASEPTAQQQQPAVVSVASEDALPPAPGMVRRRRAGVPPSATPAAAEAASAVPPTSTDSAPAPSEEDAAALAGQVEEAFAAWGSIAEVEGGGGGDGEGGKGTSVAAAAPLPTGSDEGAVRRRTVARVMARVLRTAVLPALQRNLLAAAEGDAKARKRRLEGGRPRLTDSLLAVQSMRDGSGGGGDGVAVAELARTLTASPRRAVQMEAMVGMSDRLLRGAHWLPPVYSTDGKVRRAQMLAEAVKVVDEALPAAGLAPDLITLNTLLSAYATAGRTTEAYAVLTDRFPAAGLAPDTRTFRTLITMHVALRETARAEAVLATMRQLGVAVDSDAAGAVVHGQAREWRIKDALATLAAMRADGLTCSEHHAFLLRQRCKELGIRHPDVPAHPVAWQFTPAVQAKRRAHSRVINKLVSLALRPKLRRGWR